MKKHILSNACEIVYDYHENEHQPTIVLVHGYGVNRNMWRPQYKFLKDKYSVINVDVRGHGESRPCRSFSIKTAASDLNNILLAEKCERSLLIGLSMGGYVVQEYAFLYGNALGYMLSGSSPIFLPCYSKWDKAALRHSAALLRLYPWGFLKREMARISAANDTARKELHSMFDDMTQREFIASWNGVAMSLHEETMQFDAPLLVVCGEADRAGTIKKCMKYWEPAYQGCRTKIIKNAAHVANLDNSEVFNEIMLSFIKECEG